MATPIATGKRVLVPGEDDRTEGRLAKRKTTTIVEEEFVTSIEQSSRPPPPQATIQAVHHSREEFAYVGYKLHCAGSMVTPDSILDAARRGDELGKVDAALYAADGTLLLVEWDGSVWHDFDRLEGDVTKTRRMLQVEGALVVRVRVGNAAPFPNTFGDRVTVVHVPTPHPAKAVAAVKTALLSTHSAERVAALLPRAVGSRVANVESAVDDAWAQVSADYAKQLADLDAFIGSEDLTRKLLATDSVKSRIPVVKHFIGRLLQLGVPMHEIPTFPHSFWTAVADADVFDAVVELFDELDVDVLKLASFDDSF